jgi:hypothetical protein
MANKNIEQFIATYGPIAQQVGKEINVDPNVLLSQWGLESRWGQSEMAKKHHNLGGIKDFSGTGFEAKDSKTGSMDKYVKFEDPEIFGMYYVDQIKRNFPQAANTGPDVGAFARGLAAGKRGSDYEISPKEYESSLMSAQASIPESRLLPAGEQTETAPAEVAPAVPAEPAQETDEQRDARIQATIDEQEKRQAQLMGGAVGVGISGTKAVGSGAGAMLEAGANRVGQGFRTGMQPPVTPPSGAAMPGGPAAPGAAPAAAPAGTPPRNMMLRPIPSGGPDGGRLAPGQTGTMPFNYGKAAGLTDIEAGRALDMTKQAGGVHDLTAQRREGLGKVQSLFPNQFVENPRYGGIMTPDQGVGGGPRQTFTYRPAIAPSPDLPQGQQGGLSQLPPRQPIPTAPKAPSGLDAVTDMFKGMMRPVAAAAKAVGKYVLPPLAVASAAGEGVNIAQQMRRPEGQRDLTGMALSGANILGSGLSMFPATAPVGVPVMLGTGAVQAYRENPDFFKQKMEGSANIPLLEEMTGPLP